MAKRSISSAWQPVRLVRTWRSTAPAPKVHRRNCWLEFRQGDCRSLIWYSPSSLLTEKWLALWLTDSSTINIFLLPAGGGRLCQVTDFGKTPTEITRRISWSPDSRYLYASVARIDADVVVLTNLLQH